MNQLWSTLHGYRLRFALIVGAVAVNGGVEALLQPLLLKALFDQAVVKGSVSRFLEIAGYYLLFCLALNIGSFFLARWRKSCENAFVLSLELELLERSIDLDGRRIAEAGHASYVSRVHNDVVEGVLPAIEVCVRIARQALSSVVFVGVLVYLSWQASLLLVVLVPPLLLISKRIARKIEDNTEPEREAEAQYVNTLTGTLAAFHALRGLPSLRPGAKRANREALHRLLGIGFTNFRLTQKQNTLSDMGMNLSDTASMIVGAGFVFAGRMSLGDFLAFVNSLWRAITGILDLVNTIPVVRRNAAVLRRIDDLRRSCPVVYHDCGPMLLVHGAHVRYGEDGADVRIDDFQLEHAEHVMLRGPNGCGKTTLLRLLSGTLAPDTGMVTLPPRVASLLAPVNLPPLPVRELAPDEGLRTELGLDGLAGQLPAQLSSGQRQRVGIAALLSEEADVYLADEPFANLDEHGRALVLRALKDHTRGRGLLVVHHGDEDLDAGFDRVVTLSPARRIRA